MKQRVELLLIGGNRIMRDGLSALCEREAEFKIAGQTVEGPAALDAIGRFKPTVAIVDLHVRSIEGLDSIKTLKRQAPGTKIVALSMCTDTNYIAQALAYGASAYVLKSEHFRDLARAIREVTSGGEYLSGSLDDRAIRERRRGKHGELVDKFHALTRRERHVLQLAAGGGTSTQIAARLGISRRTAETHRSNIYRKLQLQGPADLVAFALRRGLID